MAKPEEKVETQSPAAKPEEGHKPIAGIPRKMLSSLSISAPLEIKRINPLENREVEQLTQERLEELWKQLAENYKDDEKFHSLIADKQVELKNNNLFNIKVPNIYYDKLFHNYQEPILTFMHEATSNEALSYKVVVQVEQHEAKIYLPREKFDAMASRNSSMYSLRKLFPDIDF